MSLQQNYLSLDTHANLVEHSLTRSLAQQGQNSAHFKWLLAQQLTDLSKFYAKPYELASDHAYQSLGEEHTNACETIRSIPPKISFYATGQHFEASNNLCESIANSAQPTQLIHFNNAMQCFSLSSYASERSFDEEIVANLPWYANVKQTNTELLASSLMSESTETTYESRQERDGDLPNNQQVDDLLANIEEATRA